VPSEAVAQGFILALTWLAAGLMAGAYLLCIFRWWSEGVISGSEFVGITLVFLFLFILTVGSHDAAMRFISAFLLIGGSALLLLAPKIFSGASQKTLSDAREKTYRAAIEANPGNAAARGELAKLLYDLRRHDEAISEMERAVEISPRTTLSESRLLDRWRAERDSRPRETVICRQCREETPRDQPRCIHCGFPLSAAQEVAEYLSGSFSSTLRSMVIALPLLVAVGFLLSRPGPFGLIFTLLIGVGFGWWWLLKKD
jgi:hypothetical protein